MSDLEGRIALVIGGAAGIGLAACVALARKGAEVIVADRDADVAEQAAGQLIAAGGRGVSHCLDFGSLAEIEALFARISDEYGRLHILFSNVGTRCANGFDVSEDDFDAAIDINLKHHFFATRHAVPLMRKCAPQASIIYMSSGAGLRMFERSPLYSISKSGLLMMMRAWARQLGPDGIRANAVCPGPVHTAFPLAGVDPEQQLAAAARWAKEIPLGRVGQPQDVADVVAFLASDEAAYLTGLAVPVDGGFLA